MLIPDIIKQIVLITVTPSMTASVVPLESPRNTIFFPVPEVESEPVEADSQIEVELEAPVQREMEKEQEVPEPTVCQQCEEKSQMNSVLYYDNWGLIRTINEQKKTILKLQKIIKKSGILKHKLRSGGTY